jgi:hypothetical protein
MPEKARTEIWNTDTTLDEDGIHKGPECKRNNTSHPVQWIDATRRIRQNPATERSMDVAATHVSDQSNTANTTKILPMGDLWMRLQLMWLQFEVVRSPVGVNSGPVGGPLAPKPSHLDPKQSQPDHGQPQIAAT